MLEFYNSSFCQPLCTKCNSDSILPANVVDSGVEPIVLVPTPVLVNVDVVTSEVVPVDKVVPSVLVPTVVVPTLAVVISDVVAAVVVPADVDVPSVGRKHLILTALLII